MPLPNPHTRDPQIIEGVRAYRPTDPDSKSVLRNLWKDILKKYYFKGLREGPRESTDESPGFFLEDDRPNAYVDGSDATAGFLINGYTVGVEGPVIVILFTTFALGYSKGVEIQRTFRSINGAVEAQNKRAFAYGPAVFNIWHIGEEVYLGLPRPIVERFAPRDPYITVGNDNLPGAWLRIRNLASSGIAEYCYYVMEEVINAREKSRNWVMTSNPLWDWVLNLKSTEMPGTSVTTTGATVFTQRGYMVI